MLTDRGTGAGAAAAASAFLDVDEADLLAPAADPQTLLLEPLAVSLEATAAPGVVVLVDETREPGGRRVELERDWVADRLVKRFTHDRLAPTSPGPLLHGGAVADPDGSAVLVLGASGAGKSTLIAHLASAGCELLNDEQVSVHPEAGVVGGFTRPIDIKAGGIAHLPAVAGPIETRSGKGAFVAARQLGARHRLTAVPALIALPVRDDSISEAELRSLHPAEALEVLCANNLDLARDAVSALSAFAWLAATVPTCTLHYRDAASAAAVVIARLRAGHETRSVRWEVVTHEPNQSPDSAAQDGRFRVAPAVVTVHLDDRTVLYEGESRGVVRLNPAGDATWRRVLADEPLQAGDRELLEELSTLGFVASTERASTARRFGRGRRRQRGGE